MIYMKKKIALILTLMILLLNWTTPSAWAQLRRSTEIRLLPEKFTLASGGKITLTAILTSEGQPLAGKTIIFSATIGTVNPHISVTDSEGKVSVIYTAPETPVKITVSIRATFLGDLQYRESSTISSGVIEATLPIVSFTGASFVIPETLKDDISSFRESISGNVTAWLPIKLPSEAFLLATVDSLYVVFAEQSDKGLARLEGWLLPVQIKLVGLNINVVVAKSVSFEKEGVLTTVSEILANPEAYKFKLVKINAYRRQISVLYDPDEPPYIEFPLTIGYLTEKPTKPLYVIRKVLEKAKEMIFKVDEKIIKEFLEADDAQKLWLFNFEYEYWYDSPTITNGVVIPLNHTILKLFNYTMPIIGNLQNLGSKVTLYDVKTNLIYEDVPSVTHIKGYANTYMGKIVKLKASCYGGCISIQEIIEHNTPCSEDTVYIPDVGCVNIILDTRLEGFIAWNELSIPPKREELLFAVGISSFHQDEQFINVSGVFELIGKVASTSEISDSLPEGITLIIYSTRKIGEIDFEKLAIQVEDEIKDKIGELYWILQDIYPYQKQPNIPYKVPGKLLKPKAPIFIATVKEIPDIFVEKSFTLNIGIATADVHINLNLSNSLISNISIRLKKDAKNITIYFEKLIELPIEVPKPPGLVYAYHKIDVNISESSIEKANLTFWVLKEWLATHGVTKDNVVTFRYHGGEWKKLITNIAGENATHFKFIAETSGFSIFAIIIVKIQTSITITVEPKEVTVGGEVIVKGSISPALSVPITLTIKKPDGTIDTRTTTASDGSFSFNIKLDKEGEWRFIASFKGDSIHEESTSTEIKATAKPKGLCIIATAAFGTELDPHVQYLRDFRDKVVLKTFAGSNFMNVFNMWYYSWSPHFAATILTYDPLKQIVKYSLYPLIGILHISEIVCKTLSFNLEIGVISAGIIAATMIGLVYFAPPFIIITYLTKRCPSRRTFKPIIAIWLIAIVGTYLSTITQSATAAMMFTSILVLTSIVMSVMLTIRLVITEEMNRNK